MPGSERSYLGSSALICGLFLSGAATPGTSSAQTRYTIRLGVTAASHLVEDRIVAQTVVRQKIAPTLAVAMAKPIWRKYESDLELAFATGGSKVEENGASVSYGNIRTLGLTAGISGRLGVAGIRWRTSLGLLKYWGSSDQGIFRQGGPLRVVAGFGTEYRHPIQNGLELVAAARWDWHRFTTDELKARGFNLYTDVHRLSISLGISRIRP